jgi:histone H2A
MNLQNDFLDLMLETLSKEAATLVHYAEKQTMTARDVQTAVRLVFPPNLAKLALKEGSRAVEATNKSWRAQEAVGPSGVTRAKPIRVYQSTRAALDFPVGKIETKLRNMRDTERMSRDAPIYISAVLQYLTLETMSLAGNHAIEAKGKRILPRHISLAVKSDQELNKLFGSSSIFAEAGHVSPARAV